MPESKQAAEQATPTPPAAPAPVIRAFNKELAPAFLDHVCVMGGFEPPPGSPVGEGMGAGFAYCELNAGSAITTTLLAAANPLGDFHVVDARKHLVDQGRALAKEGGVRNLTFHNFMLDKALEQTLPQFDYIVLNGVYSWVPLRERALLLAFVRKFLKTGGVVYVSYNARPGWNGLEPFQRLTREASRGIRAEPKARMTAALEVYRALEAIKAPGLARGATTDELKNVENMPPEAFTYEFVNEYATPLYVTEVAADFASIDCHFAGTTSLAEAGPVLASREPFKSLFDKMPTPLGKELIKDCLLNTRLRRDVYVRGGRRLAAESREMMMQGMAFALEEPAANIKYTVPTAAGEIRVDNEHARAIVQALTRGPLSITDLITRLKPETDQVRDLTGNLQGLLLSGQIRPVYRPIAEAAKSVKSLQKAIRARVGSSEAVAFLPATCGTAFIVPLPDQIFMELPVTTPAEQLAAEAARRMTANGMTVMIQGRPVQGFKQAQEKLAPIARSFAKSRRTHYASLGLLP